ncbi:hypothetical protein BXY66_1182 [Shimia isoporae]|uniref:Aggregation factor core n=1 Tax=Shimia isoporae TaxID=647720 RepID=A0A4R1NMX8_9RHOB|nr:aggregation factor core [Shimia isoporae]TCL09139.1 hypothetical protein BXY66_1182 [Shimia isoporae]
MRIPFATVFFPTLALAAVVATHALSDVDVRFVEGAPKDRFEVTNSGACALTASTVALDLSTSQAGLIFDVTGAGAGVEVFQPFEITAGKEALKRIPVVTDGQDKLLLEIETLEPGAMVSFTIDVDDTIGQREITVSGSEIEGASVHLQQADAKTIATFTPSATARIETAGC